MKVTTMNKNELVEAFSRACLDMAMFMDIYLPVKLNEEDVSAAPLFEEAEIDNIENWWQIGSHLKDYVIQNTNLYVRDYKAYNDNFQLAAAELQQNENWMNQFSEFVNQAENNVNYLKYLPHRADYAKCLTESHGFEELKKICQKMPNVDVYPLISVDADKQDLKSAFCLGVQIVSTTGRPLVSKIETAAKRGVFRALEKRILG